MNFAQDTQKHTSAHYRIRHEEGIEAPKIKALNSLKQEDNKARTDFILNKQDENLAMITALALGPLHQDPDQKESYLEFHFKFNDSLNLLFSHKNLHFFLKFIKKTSSKNNKN